MPTPIPFLVVAVVEKTDIYITHLGKWIKLLPEDGKQPSALDVQVPPSIPRMDPLVTGFALDGVIGEFLKEKMENAAGNFEYVL